MKFTHVVGLVAAFALSSSIASAQSAASNKAFYASAGNEITVVNLTCAAGTTSCPVGGSITLDLFQATKNANSFTFFLGPLSPTIHSVVAKASGVIECWSSTTGTFVTCPTGSVANWTTAQTQALIGKRSLLVEEQNNFGTQ